jgi:hypothetical protein
LRWDDRETRFSYWIGGNYSNNKMNLKVLKHHSFPINGVIRKWSNSLSYWITLIKPLGRFLYVQYAGFDSTNGQQYTSQLMVMTQDALVIADKVCSSILPTSTWVTLGVNNKL